MTVDADPQTSALPGVRTVTVTAPFRWLAQGTRDFRTHPLPSLFYGICFALMGWLIAFTFRHAPAYVSALVTGFFLVGPFLAIGLYDLSRRRERGLPPWLAPTLDAWAGNAGAIGVFALVLASSCLSGRGRRSSCSRSSIRARCRRRRGFIDQMLALSNLEFLLAYLCIGGFFAILTFAIGVVSVPMMLDRGTDGVVAVLTSLKAFAANVPAMIVWGLTIVVLVALGFALFFVGLVVAVPVIGHATWHAYRALVEEEINPSSI